MDVLDTTRNSTTRLNKVPEPTVVFWIVKILATTVGETFADLLATNLGLGLTQTTAIMAALLAVALVVQFRTRRHVPAAYWIAVVLISIAGTLITDNLTDNFGVSLAVTTTVFAITLAVIFAAWYLTERTLSIHNVTTVRREAFYWLAILFTFALGTAAGDLIAESVGLGYWLSAVLFAVVIGLITAAYYFLRLNAVLAFWLAYILTRPLGASLGDFLSQPVSVGGMGFGTIGTSGLFLAAILILVGYLTRRNRREVPTAKH